MEIQIEVNGSRRIIKANGLKIYGSDVELKQISTSIQTAISKGLVQGWVGVGMIDDAETVFPFNGKDDVPSSDWEK